MQVDFNANVNGLDGKPLQASEGVALTVKTAVVNALLAPGEDDREIDGVEKVRRFALAERIFHASASLDISAEDTALIKRLVARSYSALVVGQVWRLIDPQQ